MTFLHERGDFPWSLGHHFSPQAGKLFPAFEVYLHTLCTCIHVQSFSAKGATAAFTLPSGKEKCRREEREESRTFTQESPPTKQAFFAILRRLEVRYL